MSEFFLNLIKTNEGINYGFVFLLVGLYMIAFWLIVCFWAWFDSNKRYKNKAMPFLIFIFILLMGFPALIFYIIIRPEHTKEEQEYVDQAFRVNGIETEKIDIKGGDGFNILLNLEVIPKSEGEGQELKVGMDWKPVNKELTQIPKEKKLIKTEKSSTSMKKVGGIFKKISKEFSKVSNLFERAKKEMKSKEIATYGEEKKVEKATLQEKEVDKEAQGQKEKPGKKKAKKLDNSKDEVNKQ